MSETPTHAAEASIWSRRTLALGATAAVLVAIADLLFYPHEPGINLALIGLAIVIALLALNVERLQDRAVQICALVAVFGLLPSIEVASFSGFLWGLFGVSLLSLAIAGFLPQVYEGLPGVLLRFGVLAPVRLIGDGLRLAGSATEQKIGGKLLRGAIVSLIPAIFAAVFAVLFVAANPVLEAAFDAINLDALLRLIDPGRFVFWGFAAVMMWPVLAPRLLGWRRRPALEVAEASRPEGLLFGVIAIRNSLMVFNLLFVVQTVMDLIYLWGGARLPDGMTHADYAHRGAYPLVVTALLAAAFVLAAMRRGGAGEKSALIRNLVYLWIAQNIGLVISSILRLDLYVEEYALTELRLAAGIWMALVAVGLGLIVAKIALNRSNAWLVAANLTTLAVTLFGLSVVDTRALIAWYDVQHSQQISGTGQPIDFRLIRQLGPDAIPALDKFYHAINSTHPAAAAQAAATRCDLLVEWAWTSADWQSWTFRAERLRQYLKTAAPVPQPPSSGDGRNC